MRPLELTVQGFKSYRDRCSFNFEGRGLFGIVGPTGAGKSSILDALIYCLYGKTPRLEKETKKLINSAEDEAKLKLSFEMDGVVWEVVRVVRRKGQSQVMLRRPDDGADPVTGDRNVNERLPQILGLDFGAFCASVCLSQGEFDRFLSATSSERVQILKGVFALDKVDELREAAKGHARLLNDRLRIAQGTIEALPGDIEGDIQAAREDLVAGRSRVDQVRAALPAVDSAQAQLQRSERDEEAIAAARQDLERILQMVPPQSAVEELVDRKDGASAALASAQKTLSSAEDAVAEADRLLAEWEAQGRGWDWCSQVESVLRDVSAAESEQAAQTAKMDQLRAAMARAKEASDKAAEAHEAANSDVAAARSKLEDTERRHAAHSLKAHLAEGKPCPVCEQIVSRVPSRAALPAMEEARADYGRAEQMLTSARTDLELSKREMALAENRVQNAEWSASRLAGTLKEKRQQLLDLAGAGNDAAAEVSKAKAALQQAKEKAQVAGAQRQKASAAVRETSARVELIAGEVLKTVTVLGTICGRLGIDSALLEEEGLPQAVKAANEGARLKLEDLDRRAAELAASVAGARSTLDVFWKRFGAPVGEPPAEILGRAISRVKSLDDRIEELGVALARRKEAERQVEELSARKALYDRLSGDLTDAKFTAYLLTEQTRLLCELASEKFHELTGYYTFDFDAQGNITVVDERTGAVRSPQDTLSGGESFLASLSLALALAETVANRGGRLDCFFLDEGFGSLDAEALDRALEGIQTLAEPGRMIGLISHVGGIQSQLEDLIVLERNGDGSTTVIQDSGPIAYLPAAI